MGTGLRPGDVVEVHLAFGSAQQEEMSHFRVEPHHLETRLLTADPTVDFLLGQVAIFPSSSGVLRWRFDVGEPLVVSVLLPMEGGVGLEVPLLFAHFLHLDLLDLFRLRKFLLLLFRQLPIRQYLPIASPGPRVAKHPLAANPHSLGGSSNLLPSLGRGIFIELLQKLLMVGVDDLALEFALLLEVLVVAGEDEPLGGGVGVGAVAEFAEPVHFLVEVVEGEAVGLDLAAEVGLGLVGLLEGDEVVLLLEGLVAGHGEEGDVGGLGQLHPHCFSLHFLIQSVRQVLAQLLHLRIRHLLLQNANPPPAPPNHNKSTSTLNRWSEMVLPRPLVRVYRGC